MAEIKEILEQAQRLFTEGKWLESNELIDQNLDNMKAPEDIAKAFRIKGWNWYYIGIKGSEKKKRESLLNAENSFRASQKKSARGQDYISVLNGFPLVLWILLKEEEAWKVSDRAIKEFPEEPSVWNTRGILLRWTKNYESGAWVGEKVYETALKKEDYRTAGHGKQNRGDALVALGKQEEARAEYLRALELYRQFEQATGQSAKFHIEGAEKKIAKL